MNQMLSDYIAMRSASSRKQPVNGKGPKAVQSMQIQKHIFDRKDPWNWKFPQRSDTMSQSTLDEEKDQVKIYAKNTLRTARDHSLNLLSRDITRKCHF